MTTEEFKSLLTAGMEAYNVPVYHASATPEDECPVLCWQDNGGDHEAGDDHVIVGIVQVQLDLFTAEEYDPSADHLKTVLNTLPVSWYTVDKNYDYDRSEWDLILFVMFIGG